MTGTMSLNRETSSRARSNADLCLSGSDRDFDVVAMQVNTGAADGRYARQLRLAAPGQSSHCRQSAGFDAQIKAAWLHAIAAV